MKNIKDTILSKSLFLFNNQGVANTSIRQIAQEVGISHSNLIYHYKTKQELIEALHEQLLQKAINLNKQTSNNNFIKELAASTKAGFIILYEYRFLMIELNYILRDNEKLKQLFIEVESIRANMYYNAINKAITEGYMKKELHPETYKNFINHIKIYSDSWISSSKIYDTGTPEDIIEKYTKLFIALFIPYFTEKGLQEFQKL